MDSITTFSRVQQDRPGRPDEETGGEASLLARQEPIYSYLRPHPQRETERQTDRERERERERDVYTYV